MPENPNQSSFIPRQSSQKTSKRRRAQTSVIPLVVISTGLFLATILASAFVFFYGRYVDKTFNQAVANLDTAATSFSDKDMLRVTSFDRRLKQTGKLVGQHVSLVQALTQLEESTVRSARFNSIEIEKSNAGIRLTGEVVAANIDALIFQRSPYRQQIDPVLGPVFGEISFGSTEAVDGGSAAIIDEVSYSLTVDLKPSNIAYIPDLEQQTFTISDTDEVLDEESGFEFDDEQIPDSSEHLEVDNND